MEKKDGHIEIISGKTKIISHSVESKAEEPNEDLRPLKWLREHKPATRLLKSINLHLQKVERQRQKNKGKKIKQEPLGKTFWKGVLIFILSLIVIAIISPNIFFFVIAIIASSPIWLNVLAFILVILLLLMIPWSKYVEKGE